MTLMLGRLGIKNIGQVAIAVSDLDRSLTFYQDILGLSLLFDVPPNLAFLDCGGVRLMLTTQQGDVSDHHTSAIYYKVDDIRLATDTLDDKGVEFVQRPQMAAKMEDHELWIGFIRDPDENLIGIMAELPFE